MRVTPRSKNNYAEMELYGILFHVRPFNGNVQFKEKLTRIRKRERIKDISAMTDEMVTEAMAGTVLVGWEGGDEPYSEEEAANTLLEDSNFREIVSKFSQDVTNFLADDYEDEIKKRLKLRSGNSNMEKT